MFRSARARQQDAAEAARLRAEVRELRAQLALDLRDWTLEDLVREDGPTGAPARAGAPCVGNHSLSQRRKHSSFSGKAQRLKYTL